MFRFIFAFFLLTPIAAFAQSAPSPVVLELFTSQGCAYCPPADELMGRMINLPGVIGLSCHVDYFGVAENNLGKRFCTARQNDYRTLLDKGQRYTPQLVVNGTKDVIGYEGEKISAEILKARAQKLIPIELHRAPNPGYYYFSLPPMDNAGGNLRVGMFVYDAPKRMLITQGNNFGKTMTYHNVVDRFIDLGVWDGLSTTRTVNAGYGPQNAGMAIIIQNIETGDVVAAGKTTRY